MTVTVENKKLICAKARKIYNEIIATHTPSGWQYQTAKVRGQNSGWWGEINGKQVFISTTGAVKICN